MSIVFTFMIAAFNNSLSVTKSTFSSHKHSYYVSQNFNVDSRENFMASEPHTPNPTQRRILL